MFFRFAAAVLLGMALGSAGASAQSSSAPTPLYPAPGAGGRSIEQQELPPLAPGTERQLPPRAPMPDAMPPQAAPAPAAGTPEPVQAAEREFCGQPVSLRLADPDTIPKRFRPFIGIWSDASWTPQLCAALVVENVEADGTAAIVYVFGPMSAGPRGSGGVLHGTGIVRDGELLFQNTDGSQFAFRRRYADLDGRLTTPRGQTYQAIFKKTL